MPRQARAHRHAHLDFDDLPGRFPGYLEGAVIGRTVVKIG